MQLCRKLNMGALLKLLDTALFMIFLVLAISLPLIDFQVIFPETLFPNLVINFKKWYIAEYGDYLLAETPNFVVGIIWLELLFQWPLLLLNIYAFLASKHWFNTTCFIYGASFLASTSAVMGELVGSNRASNTLLSLYWPFVGLGVLAMLRGLVPCSSQATINGTRPSNGMKKKA